MKNLFNKKESWLIGMVLSVLIMSSGCLNSQQEAGTNDPLKEVIIAEAGSPPSMLIYLALEKGFFKEEGLDVKTTTEYGHGQANIDAISRGDVVIGTASETPVMRTGFNEYDVSVFATIGKADRHLAIVGRKDRQITTPEDLNGKKIGVTVGSNGEFFLDLYAMVSGISIDNIEKVHVRPNEMADYLESGEVDAIVSWYPNWKKAEEVMGENAVTFYGDGIYTVFFSILASNDYIAENPDTIKAILRALLKAEKYAEEHPEEVIGTLTSVLNIDSESASGMAGDYEYAVSIDQAFLITLENEARWEIERGSTDETKVPNYMNYIHYESLEVVDSESVNMLH